ncbi:ABC transporter ATP-binding protein [Zobellella iuensis]|uniref:ABC transporter ATP-binding protein n=1 Tax=Zobellella iuensis TaxID=2803811 RepID=A0ABS1QLV9_9GAMM|nr:ABC transporter ATP-binding protein [Zobellella iuensis]MBL1375849.1 ABC transporter ATP-binding protein [Zobellella iuensis]
MAKLNFEVQGLVVQYGGVKAVDGVSFSLKPGEIRGLIGPNGAGKSTVIDAITGRRLPSAGIVRLKGEEVTRLGVFERRKRGVSRSFQRTSIFAGMRVWDQVELAAAKLGLADAARDATEVLEELDLMPVAGLVAGELGYGEQRRLDLALALVGRPGILLLDEPMAGLTVPESMELASHLKKLASGRDVSVLLVEHDMEVVFGISHSITVLELGRVLAEGEPDRVRANPRVREAYLGSAA